MRIQNHKTCAALLSLAFLAPTGCNTTTGALSGAGIGAGIGALVARKNPLAGAAIGAGSRGSGRWDHWPYQRRAEGKITAAIAADVENDPA